jgi:histidine triad (HIT) family protein
MPDCIFCKIVKKEIPAYTVWEGEHLIAFLDLRPVNPGHLLIIPREHFDTIFDMRDDLYQKLFETAKVLSTPLQQAMNSTKVGIVVEGFGVPHAHLHLVPINHAHDLDSNRAHELPEEEMKETQKKIRQKIINSLKLT